MNIEEIQTTDLWQLWEKGVNFNRMRNMYSDTDKNIRMTYGNQWEGLKVAGIEPVQFNILKRIVGHKTAKLNANLWAINYSAENIEYPEFEEAAKQACELLNKRASKNWEKDNMDKKIRKAVRQSSINSEGIIYSDYDLEINTPKREVINKNDIIYGNENDDDIQNQPYIIIRSRRTISEVQELAKIKGIKEELISLIKGDNDTTELAGEASKREVDDKVDLLTKMYKQNGTIHFEKATKHVVIQEDADSGTKLYPVAHMLWYELEGSARGEGLVKPLIPNQLEVNKTLMRRLLTVKKLAYPNKIAFIDAIANPQDLDKVGATIKVKNIGIDDVRKMFASTPVAEMSSDSEKVMRELIDITNDLENASDAATGNINPEQASGKAILAVQQAAEQPMTEQLTNLKSMIEDLARIEFDQTQTYASEGLKVAVEVEQEDGTFVTEMQQIESVVLQELETTAKVDVTPKSPYDKYAQELSLENLLKNKQIDFEEYIEALDSDSVMPKAKLKSMLKKRKEKEAKIRQMQMQAQQMKNNMQQTLYSQDEINNIQQGGQDMANIFASQIDNQAVAAM